MFRRLGVGDAVGSQKFRLLDVLVKIPCVACSLAFSVSRVQVNLEMSTAA